jgi:hypothetical protein
MQDRLITASRQSGRSDWPGLKPTAKWGLLLRMAQDYEDLAEDLENGAIEIRHPELLPQHNRP